MCKKTEKKIFWKIYHFLRFANQKNSQNWAKIGILANY